MTWRAIPGPDDDRPRPVRDSLDRYAERIGATRATALAAVFARWNEVVGPQVAAHTEPLSLVQGALVIGVDDPAWASQLRYLGSDILRRLEEVAGAGLASRIEVRVRPPKRRS